MSNSSERIIILVDMDCFYVQIEQKLAPEFMGKPCAVVQYNAWKGGGIIAVNYEARACGVTRSMRGDMAKTKCPELHLFRVREERGKANLDKYRDAGSQVMKELCQFSDVVERASIDEAYLDVTDIVTTRMEKIQDITHEMLDNTFVVGFESVEEKVDDPRAAGVKRWLETSCIFNHTDKRLAVAGILAEEIRETVYKNTGYRCSAGIAHNKMLAKLIAGLHKPNRQTILPFSFIAHLYKTIPIHKVRSLGGKFGEEVKEKLGIEMMSELATFSENELQKKFGEKNGSYLFDLAHGVENDPVTARQLSKSIGCGKNFPGKTALGSRSDVTKWLTLLTQELIERLNKDRETNQRQAQLLTISFRRPGDGDKHLSSISRSVALHSYDIERLIAEAMKVLEKFSSNGGLWNPPIINLSLSAGKFQDTLVSSSNIVSYFTKSKKPDEIPSTSVKPNFEIEMEDSCNSVDTIADEVERNTSPQKGFFALKCEWNIHEKENTQNEPEEVESKTCVSPIKGFFAKKMNQIDSDIKSPIKGFFARKMEEINSNSLDGDTLTKIHETQELVSKKVVKILSDDSSCSSDTRRGFFAKKMEELKLNNELNSMASTSASIAPIDIPKNCNREDNDISNMPKYEVDNGEFFACDDCNQRIALIEVEDHLDFHFAQKLQKEMRAQSSSIVQTSKIKPVALAKSVKRKPTAKSKKKDIKKPKNGNRTLDFYLK